VLDPRDDGNGRWRQLGGLIVMLTMTFNATLVVVLVLWVVG
jgi:hypothetical protein